jgi:hypothetical protein
LTYAPTDRSYVLGGDDPWWFMPVDVDATEFGAVALVLRASLEPRARTGCVYFATERQALGAIEPVCFTWQADGLNQEMVVPMRGHRAWTGRVTHLRVDPLDAGDTGPRGTRIALERLELRAAR